MKKTINFYDFRSSFLELRPNNFTHEGLIVLFEYFQEYEASTDIELELDVIAICCDYTQSTITEALSYYGLSSIEELQEETIVIPIDDEQIIYINY